MAGGASGRRPSSPAFPSPLGGGWNVTLLPVLFRVVGLRHVGHPGVQRRRELRGSARGRERRRRARERSFCAARKGSQRETQEDQGRWACLFGERRAAGLGSCRNERRSPRVRSPALPASIGHGPHLCGSGEQGAREGERTKDRRRGSEGTSKLIYAT